MSEALKVLESYLDSIFRGSIETIAEFDTEISRLNAEIRRLNKEKEGLVKQLRTAEYEAQMLEAESLNHANSMDHKLINAARLSPVRSRLHTRRTIAKNEKIRREYELLSGMVAKNRKHNDIAVVLHLFYPEMWSMIFRDELLGLASHTTFDLYVNIQLSDRHIKEEICKDFPEACILVTPNKGRDVLPFVNIARALKRKGYYAALKLHSKKSPQRIDGNDWLVDMLSKLMPKDEPLVRNIVKTVTRDEVGVVGPAQHYLALPVSMESQRQNKGHLGRILKSLYNTDTLSKGDGVWLNNGFFEGTMFWINLNAINNLLDVVSDESLYESEDGQTDGTFAHAVERALTLVPEIDGKEVYEVSADGLKQITYSEGEIPQWSDLYDGEIKKITRD